MGRPRLQLAAFPRVQMPAQPRSNPPPTCTRRLRCGLFGPEAECPPLACAVKRRRFPVGASPTRQPLQPEAIGAVMEVTKWKKPSINVSRIGDSARVQVATRVDGGQAPKRTMCRPTRLPYRGRLK